jgi:hypothetical protein
MALYRFVIGYRRFGGTDCSCLHHRSSLVLTPCTLIGGCHCVGGTYCVFLQDRTFWPMTSCGILDIEYQCFGGIYWTFLQDLIFWLIRQCVILAVGCQCFRGDVLRVSRQNVLVNIIIHSGSFIRDFGRTRRLRLHGILLNTVYS